MEGKPSNISYKLGSIHWSEHTGMDITLWFKIYTVYTHIHANSAEIHLDMYIVSKGKYN